MLNQIVTIERTGQIIGDEGVGVVVSCKLT